MAGTPRERARARTMQEITRIGRQHLTDYGAAALSLRAVARDLGVVSSAVYRYVRSRDELLTLLVVDGYNELGDAVDAALAEMPRDAYRARFVAVGRAVRGWAFAEPATYALLFGGPVPGYRAPDDQTVVPGTRVVSSLIGIGADAHRAGLLAVPPDGEAPPALRTWFDGVRHQFGTDLPDAVLTRGVLSWAGLFGCVSFEVFGQYGADFPSRTDAMFEQQLQVLADDLGLPRG
jgi:AcrR family transcriptional regulator